jgi:hypothetical protein
MRELEQPQVIHVLFQGGYREDRQRREDDVVAATEPSIEKRLTRETTQENEQENRLEIRKEDRFEKIK